VTGIFVSYRREDSAGWTGRLADDLRSAFPLHHVFHDIASIEIGEDFVEAMRRSLAACAVVTVVIGPRWLAATDDAGRRRLHDPEDWVRLEVVESLQRRGLRVVPVLVGGADMPRAEELPEALRPLARRNAHEISDKRWDYDVAQLVTALQRIPALGATSAGAARLAATAVTQDERTGPHAVPGAADLPPGTVFRDGNQCPEMVVVPAGEFVMGSPESEEGRTASEGPQHRVTLARAFAVGRYEVTFDEWDAYVAASGYGERPADEGWGRGRRPVINVSWEEARAYVAWLANATGKPYRLLSEAEWEYAARGGATTPYPWNDGPGARRANFNGSQSEWSGKQTAPVDSFEPNGFGLYDMIGNVWEWVQDCWKESYEGAPVDGRAWESSGCALRVIRGGSWGNYPEVARVAARYSAKPAFRGDNVGLRVARSL